jgi:hypothetical protein
MVIVQVPGASSMTEAAMESPGDTLAMVVCTAGRISHQAS